MVICCDKMRETIANGEWDDVKYDYACDGCGKGIVTFTFFEQEFPQIPITGLIASVDWSPVWELEALGVFSCENDRYLVVYISSCSCWPTRGSTTQYVCNNKVEVDRALREYSHGAQLLDMCQKAQWKVGLNES